ncbi:tetratricopeptide repeat protein [Rhodospirillaceae bacterium SYSU D60014]|uniref:SEL1-like repeat protein n=1 Tax=Virgifigura deserti TaxID=2268457 RepID=UPI0013C4D1F5
MWRSMSRAVALTLALAFSNTAAAQAEFDAAVMAYLRGEHSVALEQFLVLAQRGDPVAQYYLGQMYEYGQGVRKDDAAAIRWYRAAAAQGDENARAALARFGEVMAGGDQRPSALNQAIDAYKRGEYATARDKLSDLANKGDAEAQYHLGLIYERGAPGIAPNQPRGLRWLRKAAEQGHAQAQYRLGRAYEHGTGVERNYIEARRWYEAAADRGNADARTAARRIAAAASLETAIAAYEDANYQSAFSQFTKLAHQGDVRAQFWLGLLYDKGRGVPRNYVTAARWYRSAARLGDVEAQFNLAVLYDLGLGVSRSFEQAYRWYSAARARGHPGADAAIDRMFVRRSGGDVAARPGFDAAMDAYERRDYAWAAEQFRTLALQGNVVAQSFLASMYDQGLGVATDSTAARRWFRAAAEQGDPTAQLALARSLSRYQLRAPPDYAEAARWYRAAAEQGNPEAQMALGHAYRDGKGVRANASETHRWYAAARRARAGVDRLAGFSCASAADSKTLAPVYAACRQGDSRTALKALKTLARRGDAAAQAWLGFAHYTGWEIPAERNFHEGAALYRAAADRGNATALYNLGVIYEHGMGVAPSRDTARRWYQAAAGRGDPRAAAMSLLLADPSGFADPEVRAALAALDNGNVEKGTAELAALANQGNSEALTVIGAMSMAGRYVPQDFGRAAAAFRVAAEQGHVEAQYFLGLMNEQGLDVERNPTEALRWYEAAADQGYDEAAIALERLEE